MLTIRAYELAAKVEEEDGAAIAEGDVEERVELPEVRVRE